MIRIEIYNLLWSKTLTEVAQMLEVKYYSLHKISKEYDIPRPKPGYWVQLKYGKQPPIEKLEGDPQLNIDLKVYRELTRSSFKHLLEKRIVNIKTEHKQELKVPKRLRNKHPLIVKAKAQLDRKKANSYRSRENLIGFYTGNLSISVSYKHSSRFLRLIETFICLIEKRGHSIKTRDHKFSILTIYGENFEIKFREKCVRRDDPDYTWSSTTLVPTGKLSIRVKVKFNDKHWNDGYTLLDEQLAKIVAYLELKAQEIKIEDEVRRRRNEELEYERKLESLELYRIQWEEDKKTKLLQDVEKWDNWMKLNNYITYVKNLGIDNPKVNNWLNWVNTVIKAKNPFRTGLLPYVDSYDFDEEKVKGELGLL